MDTHLVWPWFSNSYAVSRKHIDATNLIKYVFCDCYGALQSPKFEGTVTGHNTSTPIHCSIEFLLHSAAIMKVSYSRSRTGIAVATNSVTFCDDITPSYYLSNVHHIIAFSAISHSAYEGSCNQTTPNPKTINYYNAHLL